MRLPAPLVRLRSQVASLLALGPRLMRPLSLRLGRFRYEIMARSKLRGTIAPGVQFVGPIVVEGEGLVSIGAGTRIGRNVFFESYHGATIRIGEQVTINDGVILVAYAGITIDNHVMIGEYASIRDANHGTLPGLLIHDQPHDAAAIQIGADAWLGRGVFVGKGMVIGAGAIVGANSVVTRAIPEKMVAAGAPAKPIRPR